MPRSRSPSRLPSPPTDVARARLLDEVLAAAQLDPAARAGARTLTKLADGVLAEVFALDLGGRELVLKLYRFDLGAQVAMDPDGRFHAAARCFCIPPFFGSSHDRTEPLRGRLGVALPEVLGEGVLSDGTWYTLLTRLRGRPWRTHDSGAGGDRGSAELARLSGELGALLRELHALQARPEAPWRTADEWADEYVALLHSAADNLPDTVAGDADARWELHHRVQAIAERFRRTDPGPGVLAHGDFGPENVLLDERGSVAGLIDFQLSCLAPASLDFRWLGCCAPEPFLASYGWPRARTADALWLGAFARLLWEAMIQVAVHRYSGLPVRPEMWSAARARLAAVLDELEA